MKQYSFLAFDLGATSGRTILGTLNEGKLQMKELTRFPNQILELGGHFYWNIYSLYEHLKAGMVAAAKEDVEIESIGIDTWGAIRIRWGLPKSISRRSCRARRCTRLPAFR